jgi:hydrogenase maturation protease
MNVRSSHAVVVGIGQDAAGDDGVGLLVARTLTERGITAIESTDATVVLDLLAEGLWVVVVDAVVGGGAVGDVLHLQRDDLAEHHTPLSSHGIGVIEALALASALLGADALERVRVVGVVIAKPPRLGSKLAAAVSAAVGPAAALAARLVGDATAQLA